MIGILACSYGIAGYWYFWQVLLLDASSAPRDIVACSLLGLLVGPLLLAAALCANCLPENTFH